jgi:hypothetical protein
VGLRILAAGLQSTVACFVRTNSGNPGETTLLTEAEVERSFRKLLKSGQFSQETFEKGEALLDQLRPESPLRHRLAEELEEVRELSLSG